MRPSSAQLVVMFCVQILKTSTKENDDPSNLENEDKENLGKLFFTIQYSYEATALIVTINRCTNIPPTDQAGNLRLEKMNQK